MLFKYDHVCEYAPSCDWLVHPLIQYQSYCICLWYSNLIVPKRETVFKALKRNQVFEKTRKIFVFICGIPPHFFLFLILFAHYFLLFPPFRRNHLFFQGSLWDSWAFFQVTQNNPQNDFRSRIHIETEKKTKKAFFVGSILIIVFIYSKTNKLKQKI